jgi:hypothetical protein
MQITKTLIAAAGNAGGEPSWLAFYRPELNTSGENFNDWTSISVNSDGQIALGNVSDNYGSLQVAVIEPDGTLLQSKEYEFYMFGKHQTTFDSSDKLVVTAQGFQEIQSVRLNSDFNSTDKYFSYSISYQESGYGFGQSYSQGPGCNQIIPLDANRVLFHYSLNFGWNFGTASKDVVGIIDFGSEIINKVGVGDSGGSGLCTTITPYATLSWAALGYDDDFYNYYWQGAYTDRYSLNNSTSTQSMMRSPTQNNVIYYGGDSFWKKINTDSGSVYGGKSYTINGVAASTTKIMIHDDNGNIYRCGNITISSVRYIYILKFDLSDNVLGAKLIRGQNGSNIFGQVDAECRNGFLHLTVMYGTTYRHYSLVLKTDTFDIDGTYTGLADTFVISTGTVSTTSPANSVFSYLGSDSLTNQNSAQPEDGSGAINNTTPLYTNFTEL